MAQSIPMVDLVVKFQFQPVSNKAREKLNQRAKTLLFIKIVKSILCEIETNQFMHYIKCILHFWDLPMFELN